MSATSTQTAMDPRYICTSNFNSFGFLDTLAPTILVSLPSTFSVFSWTPSWPVILRCSSMTTSSWSTSQRCLTSLRRRRIWWRWETSSRRRHLQIHVSESWCFLKSELEMYSFCRSTIDAYLARVCKFPTKKLPQKMQTCSKTCTMRKILHLRPNRNCTNKFRTFQKLLMSAALMLYDIWHPATYMQSMFGEESGSLIHKGNRPPCPHNWLVCLQRVTYFF